MLWFEDGNLYLRLWNMSHTIYAAKFEQTIIHQHVNLRRKSQSHAPAHVLMRLYPIDKLLVCLQSERRTLCHDVTLFCHSFTSVRLVCFVSHFNDMTSWWSNLAENVSCNVVTSCLLWRHRWMRFYTKFINRTLTLEGCVLKSLNIGSLEK